MSQRKLILIYADITPGTPPKYQKIANGGLTCGYREYAKCFGEIIYAQNLQTHETWDRALFTKESLLEHLLANPDAIIWSVKKSPTLDNQVLRHIPNPRFYYSCGAHDLHSKVYDINLLDTEKRLRIVGSKGFVAELHRKGKDPEFWTPAEEKEYDYVLMGTPRPGKNQKKVISILARDIKQPRRILWVVSVGYKGKTSTRKAGNHTLTTTPMLGPEKVRDHIRKARVGFLFTSYTDEGFPQSFLELTMCGVPVVYRKGAPINKFYEHPHNCVVTTRDVLAADAERLLNEGDSAKCREEAVANYSFAKSFGHLNMLADRRDG
jgi:glycosyltransferase involved in cell wall biosynthesis